MWTDGWVMSKCTQDSHKWCVMTLVFQDGSLPFHHNCSSPLSQVLHTQIANHHIQQAIFIVFFFLLFFKSWRISSKFHPATWKCCQTTTKGCRPHQRDMPPLLIPVAAVEKCKQANEFNYGHPIINYSWAVSARFAIQGSPNLSCQRLENLVKTISKINSWIMNQKSS